MELIKIDGNFFSVESLNFYIWNELSEIMKMETHSPVITRSLGVVISSDFEKFREKKEKAIKVIRDICICKKYIHSSNVMRAVLLINELGIKKEDLYKLTIKLED